VGLIDPETLAEAIAEEKNYERQGQ
jgi:hypothetical protein